ncbi:MAG TPA: L-2-hydroxyglutarate oxidase [Clostridia bacterium]|nr:L-2-hydroxyglutarate oxidase [Clostridia bacterium]
MSRPYDVIIIGAGIVGLGTALELTQRFPGIRLIVLEKEDRLAAHQTGRNSGVIHSGLYYKPGSLKAKMCVHGAAEMIAFCREHGIPHDICGKLIVATSRAELPALDELYRRGLANGVAGLRILSAEQIREVEPHAAGVRGIFVPGTGITDYSMVAAKYAELISSRGSEVKTGAQVTGLVRSANETVVHTPIGELTGRYVVNCAGLQSDYISRMAGAELDLCIVPFRGEYYEIVPGKHDLVHGLIYPVTDPRLPFLGVHFTRRVHGGVEAGPNAVLAFAREGYEKSSFKLSEMLDTALFPGFWLMAARHWKSGFGEYYRSLSKHAFVRALQKLLPELTAADIRRGGAGVRAQAIDRKGKLVDDFRFIHTEGMVHVCNVPSPAATASLVIGRAIVDMMQERFSLAKARPTSMNIPDCAH